MHRHYNRSYSRNRRGSGVKANFHFLKQRSDSMHNSICNFDSLDAFCRRCNGEMHDSTVLFTFHQVAEFNLKIQLNSAK